MASICIEHYYDVIHVKRKVRATCKRHTDGIIYCDVKLKKKQVNLKKMMVSQICIL